MVYYHGLKLRSDNTGFFTIRNLRQVHVHRQDQALQKDHVQRQVQVLQKDHVQQVH